MADDEPEEDSSQAHLDGIGDVVGVIADRIVAELSVVRVCAVSKRAMVIDNRWLSTD